LLAGKKPSRDIGDDTPPSRGSAVPKAGKPRGSGKRKGDEPDAGGMEPQPQG
jgi:cell division protease FtsH